ncbi:Lsr2 family DNA-binding protein [Gordonia alkanivorans]|uniref:Lsr2 family DNA-binding protein n=1 Tax=Gordonia alkanivorans TaxID=84096 RepID=UPI003F6D6BE4
MRRTSRLATEWPALRPKLRARTRERPRLQTDTKAIREWARENGYDVSDRGRIPADVMDAYAAAN